MERFFEGFEKAAGIGDKLLSAAKAINPLRHKHDLSPEAKKYLEQKAKEIAEHTSKEMAKKTKNLPAKLFVGSAIAGSGATAGHRLTDKLLEDKAPAKTTAARRKR